MAQPKADIQFELNKPYTNHGLTLTFVRRTACCVFDTEGRKYKIDPWTRNDYGQTVEHVKPWGQHGGHFFALVIPA